MEMSILRPTTTHYGVIWVSAPVLCKSSRKGDLE